MANTSITTVQTSQSPDAKPVATSKRLTTNWQPIIEVPNFEIPELVFGGSTVTAPGVAEIISPLLVSNFSSNTAYVDVRVYRYNDYSTQPPTNVSDTFNILSNIPVPGYDTMPIPLNGQFFYNGDILEIKSNTNNALDATISFTLGQAEEFLED